jgi:hypothetical protein
MNTNQCAHCGRKLTKPGALILGSEYGPECAHRFSGLEAYLIANGIELPLTFPMVPNAKRDAFIASPELLELRGRASRLGVRLKTESTFNVAHPFDTVTGIKSADPARFATAAEIRTTFQASLERAS